MNVADIARPEIAALEPYVTAQQIDATLRLNANESSYPPGERRVGDGLNRYPEIRPAGLRRRLAELYGVPEANLLPTRGSSEAIDTLLRGFCRPYTDNIVVASPSFSMYRVYADVQAAAVRAVPLDAARGFALDPAAVLDACTPETRLVFLCSPNNPTGGSVAHGDVAAIARARSGRSLVVVDEAYVEFSAAGSIAARPDAFDNVVVLRTLSKAWGLAGTRCGAALADRAVIGLLERILPPYSFSTPVTRSVLEALSDDNVAMRRAVIGETVDERERLREALSRLGDVDCVWPSEANFLLVRFSNPDRVQERLRDARILVRRFGGDPALERCARITVGSPDENDRLLAALGAATEARRCR